MRKSLMLFLGVLLLPALVWAGIADRIVAVVGNEVVLASEVVRLAAPTLEQLQAKGASVDPRLVHQKALDQLIMMRLRGQKAREMDIVADPARIQEMMSQVERQNQLSPGSLPAALRQQGIDPDLYREELADQLIQSQLLTRVIRPMVSVSEDEIRDLYDQGRGAAAEQEIRLSQVLLSLDRNATGVDVEQVRARALALLEQLRSGQASFEVLAGQHSDHPSGLNRGDMGWLKRGQLPAALEKELFTLEVNEVMGPVRTDEGYHIFLLTERRDIPRPVSAKPQVRVRARHLLLTLENADDAASVEARRQEVEHLRALIAGGQPFEEVAKAHSQDPGSAAQGGALGWFGPGVMDPAFEEAAFALAPGELSAPVRSRFGWHLIQVEERQALDPDSFDAKRAELETRLLDQKAQAQFRQWQLDLRRRGFVDVR
ncbi:MAG: peptidylprolyl isomerase [Magnetococcus sp. WYHC-3]